MTTHLPLIESPSRLRLNRPITTRLNIIFFYFPAPLYIFPFFFSSSFFSIKISILFRRLSLRFFLKNEINRNDPEVCKRRRYRMNNDVSECLSINRTIALLNAEFFSWGELFPLDFLPPLIFPVEAKREEYNRDVDHIFNTTVDTRGACVHLSMRRSGPCNLKGEEGGGRRGACRRGRRGGLKACLSYWRLSVLASGARNTCSDFAVNRRLNRYYPSPPALDRLDRPHSSRFFPTTSRGDEKKRNGKKEGKRKKPTLPTSNNEREIIEIEREAWN